MKVILFVVGGITGGILAIALSHFVGLTFDGRWLAAAFAIAGIIVGHKIDNQRECARIAPELDQDRIRSEQGK